MVCCHLLLSFSPPVSFLLSNTLFLLPFLFFFSYFSSSSPSLPCLFLHFPFLFLFLLRPFTPLLFLLSFIAKIDLYFFRWCTTIFQIKRSPTYLSGRLFLCLVGQFKIKIFLLYKRTHIQTGFITYCMSIIF